jgi:hypothetical protein
MKPNRTRSIVLMAALLLPLAAAAQDAPRKAGPGDMLPGPNANPPQAIDHPADASNPVQPVPGAMPDSEAVPSTISQKNAADDKLITVAYTFKDLSQAQRQAIYQALKQQPAGKAFNADVGIELPADVELHDVLDAVVAQVPRLKGYQFAVADNRVLLVAPINRVVVAALAGADGAVGSGGRRAP